MSTVTKPLSKRGLAAIEREESIKRLRELFAGDDSPRVRTILRHVSASGMSRDISLVYVKGNDIYNLTYSAALALDWPFSERTGNRAIRVSGCGMDMGFHLVYTLSRVIFKDIASSGDPGYILKQDWL